jgi:translation elongation factor EF-Ts
MSENNSIGYIVGGGLKENFRVRLTVPAQEVQEGAFVVIESGAYQYYGLVTDLLLGATDPRFVRKEEVTPEVLEREKEVLKAQAAASGKPEAVLGKIVEGKLGKFYEENCLYEQHFIKDLAGSQTVGELITSKIAKFGEKIAVRRFARFKVGEGVNKPSEQPAGE